MTDYHDKTIFITRQRLALQATCWYLLVLTRRKEYRAMVRCFLSELPQSTEADSEQLTTYCHRAATANTTPTACPPLPNPPITILAARSVSVRELGVGRSWVHRLCLDTFFNCKHAQFNGILKSESNCAMFILIPLCIWQKTWIHPSRQWPHK